MGQQMKNILRFVGRRSGSQVNAGVGHFVVCGIAVLLLVSALYAQTPPAETSPSAFPIPGISFSAPAHAKYIVPSGPGHVAEYRLGQTAVNPGILILVETGMSKGQTLDGFAKNLEMHARAVVDPAAYTVAGERAVKITAPFAQGAFNSRMTYLTFHENRLYMISALTAGADAAAAAEKILADLVATVHFTKPEAPSKHLEPFSKTPLRILDCATMNGPDCLRVYESKAGYLELGIHDFSIGDPALFIEINRINLPTATPFSAIRDNYSATLEKRMKFAEPLAWSRRKDLPGLHFSQPMKFRITPPGSGELSMIERVCMLDLGDGKLMQIIFSIPDHPRTDTKAYIDLSDKMLKSLTLRPPIPATRP